MSVPKNVRPKLCAHTGQRQLNDLIERLDLVEDLLADVSVVSSRNSSHTTKDLCDEAVRLTDDVARLASQFRRLRVDLPKAAYPWERWTR